jgi:hypothetical protein
MRAAEQEDMYYSITNLVAAAFGTGPALNCSTLCAILCSVVLEHSLGVRTPATFVGEPLKLGV